MDVRDSDEELQELPSYLSARHLYRRFAEEQCGYKAVRKNDKGGYNLIELPDYSGDLPQIKPCVLSTFLKYWRKHHPKLVISRAREDVCNDCWVLANAFRYFAIHHSGSTGTGPLSYESREEAVNKATIHVERAKAQRSYFNKVSKEEGDVLVMDFMQNLGLPYLGSEQAGATYYFSPLTVNVFGVVDMKTDMLHALCYDEGVGKKGGNNVASMIIQYLILYGFISDLDSPPSECRDSLKVIMDNCAGQNKNQMVLRLALYLVVEFVFLIGVGHTKNPCDAKFNSLKETYRKSNVYTMRQTLEKLNEHWQCTATEFRGHRDWDKYLDRLYTRFDSNTTKQYHNFNVDFEKGPTFMKIDVTAATRDANLQKEKQFAKRGVDNRAEILRELPELLQHPGVKLIKRIELGSKWREHVPEEFRDEICPVPSEEDIDQNKNNRKHKKQAVEEGLLKRDVDVDEEEMVVAPSPNVAEVSPVALGAGADSNESKQ